MGFGVFTRIYRPDKSTSKNDQNDNIKGINPKKRTTA